MTKPTSTTAPRESSGDQRPGEALIVQKRFVVIEILILFVIIFFVNALASPGNFGFIGAALHPYLLAILLVGCRYGTAMGLAAAGISLLFYGLLGYFATGSPAFVITPPHSFTLAAFLATALVAGLFSDAWSAKIAAAEAAAAETQELLKVLKTQNEVLEGANRELRSRAVSEAQSLGNLYEVAQKLTTLDEKFLYPAVLDLVVQYAGAQKCSFYLLEGDTLKLVAQKGWHDVPPEAQRVRVGEGRDMLTRVVREGEMLSLRDLSYQEEDLTVSEKIMCAPLKSPVDSRVLGVIAVESIPFRTFSPQSVKTFSLIANWTSRAITTVDLFSRSEEKAAAEAHLSRSVMESLKSRNLSQKAVDYLIGLGAPVVPGLVAMLGLCRDEPHLHRNVLGVIARIQESGVAVDLTPIHDFIEKSLEQLYLLYFERFSIEVFMEDPRSGELTRLYLHEQYGESLEALFLALGIVYHGEPGADARGYYLFTSPSEADQIQALSYLQGAMDDRLHGLIEILLRGNYKEIFETGQLIYGYKKRSLEEILTDYLKSRNRWLRAFTTHWVGEEGLAKYQWDVFLNVSHEDFYVREAALRAIGKLRPDLGERQILEAFAWALQDREPLIREAAYRALREMDDSRGLALLQEVAAGAVPVE